MKTKDTKSKAGSGRSAEVACSPPLASYDKLVRAATGQPTGTYQLTVGDLCISTNEWNKAAAEKWLPIIVDAVNAYTANAPKPSSPLNQPKQNDD